MSGNGAVRITYREAIRAALHEALTADPRVVLMGEDVGAYGGCYACSKGLLEEFGPERVRDTPLSELGFVGMGVGAALFQRGRRQLAENGLPNCYLWVLEGNPTIRCYEKMGGRLIPGKEKQVEFGKKLRELAYEWAEAGPRLTI